LKLLALDAASEVVSAALWLDGPGPDRAQEAARGGGEQLLGMVDALLAESGLSLGGLDALVLGRGPGAFTGLRLAASLVQGLAWSRGLGVIPVSNLRAVAQRAVAPARARDARILACLDARMHEVYWAGYAVDAGAAIAATAESVATPARLIGDVQSWLAGAALCGAGSGFAAQPGVLALHGLEGAGIDTAPLHARELLPLAAADGLGRAVDATQALPVYVRDQVAVAGGAQR